MYMSEEYRNNSRMPLRTILLYCEGKTETMFIKHIKSIYCLNSVRPRILDGTGGDPYSLVVAASNIPGDFDKVVVVLDNDGQVEGKIFEAREYAGENSIVLLESTPCFESLLLHTLVPDTDFSSQSSGWCKNKFQSDYIARREKRDFEAYERVFPKALLNKRRKDVVPLDQMIKIMEGDWQNLSDGFS